MKIKEFFDNIEKDNEFDAYSKALFSLGTSLTLATVMFLALIGRLFLHPEPLLTYPYDYAEFTILPILGVLTVYTYLKSKQLYALLSDGMTIALARKVEKN